ncbi:hypothetical protein [Vibrio sp. D431a]|uniref:hypothetical protein n=1 Tax=Vibrio sp. D431a TaxID=2837388 RepID=UPI0025549B50|nr:hypothetical protein [Vibrio sp. D431a]MDK9790002.1 hypothetical protein [Vibrio sp. D431a]
MEWHPRWSACKITTLFSFLTISAMNKLILNRLATQGLSGLSVVDEEEVNLVRKNVLPYIVDENGLPRIVDHVDLLSRFSLRDVKICMQISGIYVLPTIELMEDLRKLIPDLTKTIEIGSGNGIIAKELGIKATDNYMQHPDFRVEKHNKVLMEELQNSGNQLVRYGSNVLRVDGNEAVKRFKPKTALACFVTHKYSKSKPEKGGNFKGVDFEKLVRKVNRLVFVGNDETHKHHTLLEMPMLTIRSDGLITRSDDQSKNGIFIFDKVLFETDMSGENLSFDEIINRLNLQHIKS